MKIDVKKLSISNLNLIILNNKQKDDLRKSAEEELKTRVVNESWNYNDLLEMDNQVIQKRGLDVRNYLLSTDVSMQQLMETYFAYSYGNCYYNDLLFSEKHLCNEMSFGGPFFRNVVDDEIKNISKRIESMDLDSSFDKTKKALESARDTLKIRQERDKNLIKHNLKNKKICELIYAGNEAVVQLDTYVLSEYLFAGLIEAEKEDTGFSKDDIKEYINILRYVQKDSGKLRLQKSQLQYQAGRGYEVDYESDVMKKVLPIIPTKKDKEDTKILIKRKDQ